MWNPSPTHRIAKGTLSLFTSIFLLNELEYSEITGKKDGFRTIKKKNFVQARK